MQQVSRAPRKQTRSVRTRTRIVEGALRVFTLKGYREASMDDVCHEAGCSKGGLYHHFASKSAILVEVASRLGAKDGLPTSLGPLSTATGLPERLLGRLLVDVWAEASRDSELAARVRAYCVADAPSIGHLVQSLMGTSSVADVERAA
jgi:AcrR family transcriptional regulator